MKVLGAVRSVKLVSPLLFVATIVAMAFLSPGIAAGDVVTNIIQVGSYPTGVAVTPDGSRVYVTNAASDTVSAIATASGSVVATVPVGNAPYDVAATPDGTRAYVINNWSDSISVIDIDPVSPTFHTVVDTIWLEVGDPPISVGPIAVAMTPDGSRAYVAGCDTDFVLAIDVDPASPTFHTVLATVQVAPEPCGVAITPDGTRAYVKSAGLPEGLSVIDIDPASGTFHTMVAFVPLIAFPEVGGVAITPDGSRAYVVSEDPIVSVVDTDPDSPTYHTLVDVLEVGTNTVGVAITPEGKRAYVADYSGDVLVIDTDPASPTFHTVVDTVVVGAYPNSLKITPDGWFIYVSRFVGASVSVIARYSDTDGCADAEEGVGAAPPKPGSTGAYDPFAWYDFYDVPVPSLKLGAGTYSGTVTMADVLAVLDYVGVVAGSADYEADRNGNTVRDGLEYDRSPSVLPNPPWGAGPPSGAVNISDVLAALAQVGLDCSGPP